MLRVNTFNFKPIVNATARWQIYALFLCCVFELAAAPGPPQIINVSPAPGQITSLTSMTVTFSEPVTNIAAGDLLLGGVPRGVEVTGSGAVYTFALEQPPYGVIQISWDTGHSIVDFDVPPTRFDENHASSMWQYDLVDTVAPTIASLTPAEGITVRTLTRVEVTFSEPVLGIDAGDLLINGASASDFAVVGAGRYLFTFPQPTNGTVAVTWSGSHGIVDFAANPFAGGSWTYTLDPAAGLASIRINEFLAANVNGIGDGDVPPETNDWIEIWNYGINTVNLNGYALTDDKDDPGRWTFPSTNLAPGQFLVVFASEKDRKTGSRLHTNFKLNPNGEYLGLFNAELPRQPITEFAAEYPEQRNDYSYGYDATNALKYFATPTPGAANGSSAISDIVEPPHFNVERGLFDAPFTLHINSSTPGASIRYTTDGTEPTASSGVLYQGSLLVTNTSVFRALAYKSNSLPSVTVTHSYLFLEQVVRQPNNPAGFPTNWGPNSGFPGGVVPADYEMDMDPLRVDPNNASSAIDPVKMQRLKDGLRELPTLSIVMKTDDIFGTAGLYQRSAVETGTPGTKPENKKPCSIEFILPDGTTAFATTCGIDLHGNASRNPIKNPKHGFKLSFRGDFGPPNLDYRLFEDSAVEEFDDVLLRADFNSSWRHWSDTAGQGLGAFQRTRATRTRDAWMKESMRDMGGLASHNRFFHLYLNGLYWGAFEFSEDPTESFAKTALGGTEADFDIVDQGFLKNGTINAYNAMLALPAATTLPQYEQYFQYLNVPEFIDYMLLHLFMGHQDWATAPTKNWSAIRKRVPGLEGTFRYVPWDGECILLNENVDRLREAAPANLPSGLQPKLDDSPEYRLAFADHVHRHMIAPNGALVRDANIARWQKWQAVMDKPIVAESARWGDYRRDVHQYSEGVYQLYTRENHWLAENTRMLGYFSNRHGIVLSQLRSNNLYPAVSAPVFNQQGGLAARGFNLTMTATNPIYFTLDGADPRVYGTSAVSPNAALYSSAITISNSVVVKARALFGTTWSALNEATFVVDGLGTLLRITEIMYNPIGGDAYEYIELQNVGSLALNVGLYSLEGVTYTFPPNTIIAPGQILVLASDTSPGSWSSRYPGVTPFGFFGGRLDNGGEKLAIRDPQDNPVYSVDYDDENGWPTQPDGGGYSLQIIDVFGDPDNPANWRASDAPNGTPGTLAGPPPPPGSIVLNEVMAENISAVPNGATYPDWIEIRNTAGSVANLAGWSLTDDGAPRKFVFPTNSLSLVPANGYLVVWCDSTTNVTPGLHTGFALGKNGETIFLYNASTVRVDSVTFGLQLSNNSVGVISNTWRLTTPTPNAPNVALALGSVTNLAINEWLADAVPGGSDWIELYNRSTAPVSLQGIYLGNGSTVFQITALSFIPPRSFVQLLADELPGAQHLDFKLDAAGGVIELFDPAGELRDRITYGLQSEGVSQGRLPDGAATIVSFPATPSPGADNYLITYSGPRLNELLAINDTVVTNSLGRTTDWIELYNTNSASFDLSGMRLTTDPNEPAQWTFPAGTTMAANGYLVVWFDDGQPASTTAGPLLNTGRSLDGESGQVYLVNAAGQIVDSVVYGFQAPDLSVGLSGGAWALLASPTPGAANAASASLGMVANLRLNEWMAEPLSGNDWFEIYNNSDQPVALLGVYVTDNLSIAGSTQAAFSPLSFIGPRGFIRVVADSDPSDGRDHVSFSLDGHGEALRIYAPAVGAVDTIYFGEQEPGVSEGRLPDGGPGIVRFTTTASPAESNYLPLPNAVINEALSHTDDPLEDAVEIFNPTATTAEIGGWYLSDHVRNLKKYRIAAGTTIPPLGFKVFYQNDLTSGPGALIPFTLDSAHGDAVYLSRADAGGNLVGYRAVAQFGAAANSVSFGRYVTTVGVDFPPLEGRSFGRDNPSSVTDFRTGTGAANTLPRIGPIVINEIMFHPPDDGTNDNTTDEYIELHNITTNSVALYDPAHTTNTWRIRGGVDFEFPPGVALSSRAFALIVSFNPVTNTTALNAFRSTYGIPGGVPIFGPYRGKLDNGGEEITLLRPDAPQTSGSEAGFVPYLLTDRLAYDDDSPWPVTTDGGGASLQRRRPYEYGNDPVNWKGEGPTPARPNVPGSSYTDADADGISDAWELANGLSSSNRADADADADGDGESNLHEYWAGTDPQTGSSVLAAPVITSHPEDVTGVEGVDATFSVVGAGSAPLSYKWQFNGRDIPGATSPMLAVSSAGADDAGQYQAIVMNSQGYAVSRVATLVVRIPPRITQHPQSRIITNNNSVTFNVVATGTGTLFYQWRRYDPGAMSYTNIPGATATSYGIANAQTHDSGTFVVVVTDDIASITSNPAVLEVRRPPTILQQPVTQTVPIGGTASFFIRVSASLPVNFQWRKAGVPVTNFLLFDTNCTLVIQNVQASHAGTYTCVVSNAAINPGVQSSPPAALLIPPFITLQPTNQTANPGNNVALVAQAIGSVPLAYQWRFYNTNLPGATRTNLALTNVQPANAGPYFVVITNLGGSITSSVAMLTIPVQQIELQIDRDAAPTLVILRFDAAADTSYSLEHRDSLATGSWELLQTIAAGPSRQIAVTNSTGGTSKFYRLRTPAPP
jgi:hypothetical protein